jgi:zinc transport system substrate-binding protein
MRRNIEGGIKPLLICLLALSGCKHPEAGNYIAVTIEPQRYFAEKIGGDRFVIHTVVLSGQSPEMYDPTPQQMAALNKSLAYLQTGHLGFEQAWMGNILANNPHMQVFDLSEGFDLIAEAEDYGHHHGIDPHIWSSVGGARVMAANILKAFVALDKQHEDYYKRNYKDLLTEINETEAAIRAKLSSPLLSRTFIIYHPALTYFAREFGLTQLCIETDGKEPSPAQLKELVDTAKEHRAKVIFVQQEFDEKNAELIARETGCRLVSVRLQDYRWSREMIRIASALADE